jgi:hypothetical protein
VVDALEVVVVDVPLEVALEPGESGRAGSGEGGPPALLQDQFVQRLDDPVRLRPLGADQGVADAELVEGGAEVAGSETRRRCR